MYHLPARLQKIAFLSSSTMPSSTTSSRRQTSMHRRSRHNSQSALSIGSGNVTRVEMKAFIAMILNMGIIQLSDLKDSWATDDTVNLPFFRSVFSRDRFFQIFGALHVGDIDSTTKRGKIQPFLDRICPSFEAAFTPDQQIAIDESVISFKGRVSFRQYLKGKPHPWGIKAILL